MSFWCSCSFSLVTALGQTGVWSSLWLTVGWEELRRWHTAGNQVCLLVSYLTVWCSISLATCMNTAGGTEGLSEDVDSCLEEAAALCQDFVIFWRAYEVLLYKLTALHERCMFQPVGSGHVCGVFCMLSLCLGKWNHIYIYTYTICVLLICPGKVSEFILKRLKQTTVFPYSLETRTHPFF